MNGTSGFQEVRFSTTRSSAYRLLQEQQPQFGTGSWHFLLLRTEGVSQVCLTLTVMMIAILSFPAYVWSADAQPEISHADPTTRAGFLKALIDAIPWTKLVKIREDEPLCRLQPDITGVHVQDNSAWCWAASTHLVIRHHEPASNLKQCDVVYNTLKSTGDVDQYEQNNNGVKIDCCRVTDDALISENQADPVIIGSKTVCHTTSRPEWALRANGYVTAGGQDRFKIVRWDPTKTIPEGVPWSDLTSQICMNRPFISVKLWVGGGTHSEVVTGYRHDPDGTVVLDSHSSLGVHTMSYDDYLRDPGITVGRVRDYYDIGL